MSPQYLTVEDSRLMICYPGTTHVFVLNEINAVFVAKRRIPFHKIISLILLITLFPLLLLCIKLESFYWTVGISFLYVLLFALHNKKIYKLCVKTRTGDKWYFPVKRRHKKQLLVEVSDFLDDFYEVIK